jgi:hypothetical protein
VRQLVPETTHVALQTSPEDAANRSLMVSIEAIDDAPVVVVSNISIR